ncbi:MAG: multiubiquitin domain-containing protein [Candidatus Binataceae bacterium]
MSTQPAESKTDRDHEVTIVVNGRQRTVDEKEITFDEAVKLAFDNPPTGENVVFSVTYRRAEGNKSGTLEEGGKIKVKEGMVFDVTATDKS